MVTVRLENIVKIFEQKLPSGEKKLTRALDNVDLTIKDGETVSVVGPSGCGKSTLLRIIAGLEPANEGTVYFDDKDVTKVEPKDRGIGIVFQNYALYPHYKSKGNLSFFFKLRKRTEEEINERVRVTAETLGVGFDELLNRKPGQLSGGQQQRVALGRCIIKEPTIFLLDEPLSNLDAKLRERTRIEIKRLLRRFKVTSFYVTHDQVEAITLGDRIAVMRSGIIEQIAPYRELLLHPVNMFVANFIGLPPMRFIDCKLNESKTALIAENLEVPVTPEMAAIIGDSERELALGTRPDGIRVELEPQENSCPANVDVVEPVPNEGAKWLYISFAPGVEAVAKGDLHEDFEVNSTVHVVIDPEKLFIFDKSTEQAIVTNGKKQVVAEAVDQE